MYCCCIAASGTWSEDLVWGTHSPWLKSPPLKLEFWLFTHNSLVFINSHWYQYQAIRNLHVDFRDNVGGWGYKINIFSHFGPDVSSPGLTLVPTGIIKPRNLLKKLSKHERRQTNGYRMRFIVNFNQRIAM